MTQVVDVAQNTETKNTIITSPNVAVIDVKKEAGDSPNPDGVMSFSLPPQDTKDLNDCKVSSTSDENTILLVCLLNEYHDEILL